MHCYCNKLCKDNDRIKKKLKRIKKKKIIIIIIIRSSYSKVSSQLGTVLKFFFQIINIY